MLFFKKKKDNEIKEFVLKNYFNAKAQKRYVKEAVRKSTQDQRNMLKRYDKLFGKDGVKKHA